MIKTRNNGELWNGSNAERLLNFPSPIKEGMLFRETDTGMTYIVSGHSWVLVSISEGMQWQNEWVSSEYNTNDVVVDGSWTMVANKVTTDRAAPQPFGEIFYLLPESPSWTPQSQTDVIWTGTRISNLTDAYLVSAVRVWLPDVSANVDYRVILEDNLTGINTISQLFNGSILDTPGWFDTPIVPFWLTIADDVTIWLLTENTASTTTFNHPWVYTGTSNQNNDPASGNVNINNQDTTLRINKTDDDTVDQTSDLVQVITGTVIRIANEGDLTRYYEYEVLSQTDNGTWVLYDVTFIEQGSGGAPLQVRSTTTFTVPVPALTDYVEITNGWSSHISVNGEIIIGSGSQVSDQNTYGVDILIQQYTASDDWDMMAYSGSSGAGSSVDLTGFAELDLTNQPFKSAANSTTAFQIQQSDSNTVFNVDTVNGRVGIGIDSSFVTEAVTALGNFRGMNVTTDLANKNTRFVLGHYDNSEEDVLITSSTSTSTLSLIDYGGGSTIYNTATQLRFFAADNTTTLVGTNVMTITTDGLELYSGNLALNGGWINHYASEQGIYINTSGHVTISNSNVTDTIKRAYLTTKHYDTSEEDIALFLGVAANGSQWLTFGGGSSVLNAVNNIYFKTSGTATTLNGTQAMRIDYAQRVLIGSGNASAKLHIFGTTDETQQIIQANSAQTNNLTEWQNSSGVVQASLDPNGGLLTGGHRVKSTETSTTTVTMSDDVEIHFCNSTTAYTLTLPTHVVGKEIKIINKNTGIISLDATINGSTSQTLSQYRVARLISDGTEWYGTIA